MPSTSAEPIPEVKVEAQEEKKLVEEKAEMKSSEELMAEERAQMLAQIKAELEAEMLAETNAAAEAEALDLKDARSEQEKSTPQATQSDLSLSEFRS